MIKRGRSSNEDLATVHQSNSRAGASEVDEGDKRGRFRASGGGLVRENRKIE
jgi:hypothetical protein